MTVYQWLCLLGGIRISAQYGEGKQSVENRIAGTIACADDQ